MPVTGPLPSEDPTADPIGQLEIRLTGLEEAVASLRELVVRAYEQTPAVAASVLRLRRSPTYSDSYAEVPLVSVRIGTHQGGETFFDRALRSVSAQTYENWEAIVVCDGPDEATRARITALRDPRIRCDERPRNGPYPNEQPARWLVAGVHPFNEAVADARGAWIAAIDQDDEWTPDHLQVLVSHARHSKAEVVYGAFRAVVADEGETYFGGWPPEQGNFGFQAAIYHAGLADLLYDANAYLVGEPADWHLARRMLEAGVRFDFAPRIVGTYYIEADSHAIGWWRERIADRGRFVA